MPVPALPCIACGKPLASVNPDGENHCYDGLAFRSYGQYGSTSFDPMNGEYLEINLCDECLLHAAKAQQVLWGRDRALATVDGSVVGTVELKRPFALVPWQPELEEHPQAGMLGWSGSIPREGTTPRTVQLEPEED